MIGLDDLLRRIRYSLNDDTLTKAEVAQCIKGILNFNIEPNEISLKGDTLRIKTTPTKRNEIKLNEGRILEAVRSKTRLAIRAIVY